MTDTHTPEVFITTDEAARLLGGNERAIRTLREFRKVRVDERGPRQKLVHLGDVLTIRAAPGGLSALLKGLSRAA
jgi:hypothetical protein